MQRFCPCCDIALLVSWDTGSHFGQARTKRHFSFVHRWGTEFALSDDVTELSSLKDLVVTATVYSLEPSGGRERKSIACFDESGALGHWITEEMRNTQKTDPDRDEPQTCDGPSSSERRSHESP